MASKRKPILMRRVADYEHARKLGDFWWLVGEEGERTLYMLLPGRLADDHLVSGCRIGTDGWFWDGDSDRPTLKPSVRCKSHDAGEWHGFVTNGFLVEA